MLGKLFGSNARVKILKLFLLNPERKYYIRQLARDLDLQVNSVRRELENLKSIGLLISDISREDNEAQTKELEENEKEFENLMQGKVIESKHEEPTAIKPKQKNNQEKKFYQANKHFILYEEIKSLFLKSQVLYEKDFVEKLKKVGKPKLLILTGFFVNNKESIVDILAAGKIGKTKFTKLIKDLEKELGREINYTLMDSNELKYRREMADVFLLGVLEGKSVIVIDEPGTDK